jgi:hypothetical protein
MLTKAVVDMTSPVTCLLPTVPCLTMFPPSLVWWAPERVHMGFIPIPFSQPKQATITQMILKYGVVWGKEPLYICTPNSEH